MNRVSRDLVNRNRQLLERRAGPNERIGNYVPGSEL